MRPSVAFQALFCLDQTFFSRNLTASKKEQTMTNLPYSLRRFLDTLGIADDVPWRPAFDGQEVPF
jgi:hypothetical protein